MAIEKLFTVAGVSTHAGETKVRFGNDLVSRIKIMSTNGDTDVRLIEIPASTKLQALEILAQHADYQDADANFAIQSKLNEKRKIAKKGEVKVAGASIKATTKAPEAV